MSSTRLRNILLVLFAISGFTGLIYESIWSHYLKLFLGHAAYSQALVLAIFMGGMALGAWLASKGVYKWRNLLLIYAGVELAIGIFGMIFHPAFIFIQDQTFLSIIPSLESLLAILLFKWGIATLLILPQSILLGMTFPLMSNGLIRVFPQFPGASISMLYFTNSLGAAIGVLISGFVLISAVGLPGTILTAGIINILLALIVYAVLKQQGIPAPALPQPIPGRSRLPLLILCAAFITGMASFIYEIAWLRMLSMVLGGSTHSFELMLSAFIFGLAFGGLWIRRRIDRYTNPVLAAAFVQIIMGICALYTVALYNYTFDLMAFLMSALQRTDQGYYLFTIASHFISLLVMLPTTFCAGMTLPLFTRILLNNNGEKSIGQVYASNTLGAIVGVAFTIAIAMPEFGLKTTMITGAGLDVLLGLVLLVRSVHPLKKFSIIPVAVCLLLFACVSYFVNFDYARMSSTVYRTGRIYDKSNKKLLFHKDGKTATVHVLDESDGYVSINTNGKPDALINTLDTNPIPGPDEATGTLLAAIPVAINPEIKAAANIGMGSGLTTHVLLTWPNLERVDTVEIEPAMVEGAAYFRPRVERTFSDPRSHIHIEDAKTYFSNHKTKYDLITSEPSNPWVSGVASLFTDEFYSHIKHHLSKDGIFVQWLQVYEVNLELVLCVLKALDNNFEHYVIYAANDADLIIVAKNGSPITMPQAVLFDNQDMKHELSRVGIYNIQDFNDHIVATRKIIKALFAIYKPETNSDYFPVLDLYSPEARFKQEDAFGLARMRISPIPIITLLAPELSSTAPTHVDKGDLYTFTRKTTEAEHIYDYLMQGRKNDPDFSYSDYEFLLRLNNACDEASGAEFWINKAISLAYDTMPYLNQNELNEIFNRITPECPQGLSEMQNMWLNLFKAMAQRNPQSIADASAALLRKNDHIVEENKRELLGLLILSLVKMGDYSEAASIGNTLKTLFTMDSFPLGLKVVYGMTMEKQAELAKKPKTAK